MNIDSGSFDDILDRDGKEGMKSAVGRLKGFEMMDLPDPALFMDADTPEAYEAVNRYGRERAVPSKEACMRRHEDFKTPEDIIRHCEKVASVSERMAKAIIDKVCSLLHLGLTLSPSPALDGRGMERVIILLRQDGVSRIGDIGFDVFRDLALRRDG